MGFNTIGLPVDIPWRRICVTDDMIDPQLCDGKYPSPFKSSIAIFRFDPELDEEPIEGYKIAYIKVSCSITPYKIDLSGLDLIDASTAIVDEKLVTQPCYGALLQVAIGPESGNLPLKDYPYFLDFEPKKREEYEVVTETGGLSSGSASQVTLGKSTTNTSTTERYDVLTGAEVKAGIFGAEVSGKWGSQSEAGTSRAENQSSDSSTDRRETKSHTSAFTNIYSLFQAFHIGTNRGLFFIEPRPFVVTSPRKDSTFIKGLRKLEGIQEVFFVVAYKYESEGDDFCINTKLETAHIATKKNAPKEETTSESFSISSGGKPPRKVIRIVAEPTATNNSKYVTNFTSHKYYFADNNRDATIVDYKKWEEYLETKTTSAGTDGIYSDIYTPPSGWEIDVDKTKANTGNDSNWSVSKTQVKYSKYLEANKSETKTLSIVIKQINGDEEPGAMFIVSRDLCCCEDEVKGGCTDGYVPYYKNITANVGVIQMQGDASSVSIGTDTGTFARKVRQEIITSIDSERRTPCGEVPPNITDVVTNVVTNTLTGAGPTTVTKLTQTISESLAIPPEKRDVLEDALGSSLSVLELLHMDSFDISKLTGISRRHVHEMKSQIQKAIMPSGPKPITRPLLRKITGISVLSTYPDPLNPRKLGSITDPNSMLSLNIGDQPNVIEVDFSGTPDSDTVATASFFMTKGSQVLSGTIEPVTSRKYRLVFSTPLDAFGLYTLTLLGNGSNAIKFNGLKLDGDPIGIPSGDNIEGGDFTAAIRVNAPINAPAIPTMPATLIKVVGMRVLSSQPDSNNPRIISEIMNPGLTQVLNFSDVPDTIEVDFNVEPDGGTLTTSTFTITTDAGSVAATLTNVTSTRARLKMNSAPLAGTVYKVTLDGTTGSAIKYQTRKLDGDPTQIPSGNNSESGDFVINFKVGAAIPVVPTPDVLLKVIGARVSSSSPDPNNPRILREIVNLGSTPDLYATEVVDVVDIDFNVAPDANTVTSASFTMSGPSGAVTGTVTSVNSTKFRFKATTPLSTSGIYHIKVSGVTELTAKYQGRKLDGEPIALPSGDGIPGGDFGFNFYLSV